MISNNIEHLLHVFPVQIRVIKFQTIHEGITKASYSKPSNMACSVALSASTCCLSTSVMLSSTVSSSRATFRGNLTTSDVLSRESLTPDDASS